MLLQDKVSIITGAARGIGRSIALTFAREGSNIVIADVDQQKAEQTKKEITSLGREVLSLVIDVTDCAQVEDMVKRSLDKFGKIDILINNAGITRDSLLLRMKESDWDAVLDVNLKGTFNCTKAVSKIMMKQRTGRIVNIASVIGMVGNVGQSNYAASKAGVIGFTKTAARELASRGINVNAIAPGFIQTDMTKDLGEEIKAKMLSQIPLNRFGDPAEVSNLALFLVTDASNYITGQVIRIDGGMAM